MGLITGGQYLPIADRIARQAINLEDAVVVNNSGLGYYVLVHDPLCSLKPKEGDFEIENDLIFAANTTDEGWTYDVGARAYFTNIINALNQHVVARGSGDSISSMDDYLNTSGINVHELYAVTHEAITGSALDAVNVYRDDEVLLATVEVISSGVATFTDGEKLGTGTGDFVRDVGGSETPNSAQQPFKYAVEEDIGVPNDLVLAITGRNEQGNAVQETVTISSGTTSGTTVQIGTAEILDVIAVQVAGGNAGGKVQIRSIVERDPEFDF